MSMKRPDPLQSGCCCSFATLPGEHLAPITILQLHGQLPCQFAQEHPLGVPFPQSLSPLLFPRPPSAVFPLFLLTFCASTSPLPPPFPTSWPLHFFLLSSHHIHPSPPPNTPPPSPPPSPISHGSLNDSHRWQVYASSAWGGPAYAKCFILFLLQLVLYLAPFCMSCMLLAMPEPLNHVL